MNETQLKKYNWVNPPNFVLPRRQEIQDTYNRDIGTDKQKHFIQNVKDEISKKGFTFVPNTYPYNVKPPIKHSCLWYKGIFTPKDVILYLNLNDIDYITFFENDIRNKSIKSISHYHIFHY